MMNDGGVFATFNRIIKDKTYRKYAIFKLLYSNCERKKEKRIKFFGNDMIAVDAFSFICQYKDIFANRDYYFEPKNDNPIIIDIGANIGMSCLFFSLTYPNATIEAYEADPNIFEVLKRNMLKNNCENVHLHNSAVLDRFEDAVSFSADGADGGRVEVSGEDSVKVSAIDALTIISEFEHIDLLKLDIEGAERLVVPRIESSLSRIDRIFMEYHSETNKPQKLAEILHVLENEGFRLRIRSHAIDMSPFSNWSTESGFDMQVDCWAIRNP